MTSRAQDLPAGGARRLGQTDVMVSRLGYGAMELAGPPRARALTDDEVVRLIHESIDRGIVYYDTSIDYGLSERRLGLALDGRRDQVILASKCACQVGLDGPQQGGEKHIYTAENVVAGVEQSLRRLRTDRLDVVQVHGDPTRQELEDGRVPDALIKLKEQGKVRCVGISSRLPKLAEFVDAPYFQLVQVPYSPLQRQNEDVIAALRAAGKAVVARGVTGRGAPAKSWATRPIGTTPGESHTLWERADLDSAISGMAPIEFMIRFVLSNPAVDVALVATTDRAHLVADIEAANRGPLPKELYALACDRLAAVGGGAGQGDYARGGPTPIP